MLPAGFQLAPDFPDRLREFIDAVGLEHQEAALFAAVLPKQISEWLAGRQRPSRQRLNLLLASTPGGPYPAGIFAADGPRPRDTVNVARLPLTELRKLGRRPMGTGIGVVAERDPGAQYERRTGNTPETVTAGGEERPGSPVLDAIQDEAAMAVTALQRAIRRALEKDEYTHTREGRDLVVQELEQFAERLGLIGLGDVGLEVMLLANRMRRPELTR